MFAQQREIGCEMSAFIYLSWFYVFVQFLLLIRIEREQKNEDPAVTFLGHHFHKRGHSANFFLTSTQDFS